MSVCLIMNISNELTPYISLQLFDSFVNSSLKYTFPVWGFSKSKDTESVHIIFCKYILGVKFFYYYYSCNNDVNGELGRYPLYVNIKFLLQNIG